MTKSKLIYIVQSSLIIGLIGVFFWIGDLEKGLFTPLGSPVIGFNQLNRVLDARDYGIDLPVSLFRGILSLTFGKYIETRLYFSALILFVYYSASRLLTRQNLSTYQKATWIMILTINPFTISRLSLGHDKVLISYGFLLIAAQLYYLSLEKYASKSFLNSVAAILLLTYASPQYIPIIIPFVPIALLYFLIKSDNITVSKSKLFVQKIVDSFIHFSKGLLNEKTSLAIIVACLLLNLLASYNSVVEFEIISNNDLQIWMPDSESIVGLYPTLLSMHGLWVEKSILYSLRDINLILFLAYTVSIGGITVLFFKGVLKKTTVGTVLVSLILLITLFLSAGILNIFPLNSLFKFLFDIGIVKGIRESTKAQIFLPLLIYVMYVLNLNETRLTDNLKVEKKYFTQITLNTLMTIMGLYFLFTPFIVKENIKSCKYPDGLIEAISDIDKNSAESYYFYPIDGGYYSFCDQFRYGPWGALPFDIVHLQGKYQSIGGIENPIFNRVEYTSEQFEQTYHCDIIYQKDELFICKEKL